MDREPITHGGVFNDPEFAGDYARKHWKVAAGFGASIGKKMKKQKFRSGRILDAGCGFGGTLLTMADDFPESELMGVDLSEPLLEMARAAAEKRTVLGRVSFERADVLDLPFPDRSFDVVLNLNMAHLVDDPARMLSELDRVLAPQGLLFLVDLKRSALGWVEKEIRAAFSKSEAKELLAASPLRGGSFSSGLIWWRYEQLPQP